MRISLLLFAFAFVVTGFFLNKIGLPEFAKQSVIRQLRAHGWEAEFSRLRLRWYRGIVADDLHLRRTNGLHGPNLFVGRAESALDFSALVRLRLDINSFKMSDARVVWPIARRDRDRHQPPFNLNNVSAELYFHDDDRWELRSLNGELLGARVRFTGSITNGSHIRDWRFAEKRPGRPRRDPVAAWEEFARTVAQVQFRAQPQLDGTFRGDAADFRSFDANLRFKAQAITSPWGLGTNLLLTARLFPGRSDAEGVQADFILTASQVSTDYLHASEFRMNLEMEPRYTNAWPTNVNLAIELKNPRTQWGAGEYALLTSRLTVCPTNASLLQTDLKAMVKNFSDARRTVGDADIRLLVTHPPTTWLPSHIVATGELKRVATEIGDAANIAIGLDGNLPHPANWLVMNTNLSWPERFRALPLRCDANATRLRTTSKIETDTLAVRADWRWPHLGVVTRGSLYGGAFAGEAQCALDNRQLTFKGQSDFDVHQISPLLPKGTRKFLSSYSWDHAPALHAEGRLTLPPATNNAVDWDKVSDLAVSGGFRVGRGGYKGVTFTAAEALFNFTNKLWRIDNLAIKRPEGELRGAYTSMPASKNFHWKLRSEINPLALKPLFTNSVERAFNFFEFTSPPLVEGEVWGNWLNPERIGVHAKVRAKDFKFRGETIGQCATTLIYSNFFLAFINPEIQRPGEKGVAPGIGMDFKVGRLWITNAFGNLDPQAVSRCIGRHTAKAMEDYIYDVPPTTRVNGTVDLKRGSDEDDLHFEIQGGSFHWRNFNFTQLSGKIDWIGRTMVLTNMQGIFHGGRAEGHAHFAFPRKLGADFSFKLTVVEVDFQSFMSDIMSRSNRLDGMLNGELTIVAANTSRPNSWMGYGNVHLRDGLIWDIPVFGLLSPILNAIAPGIGNSRAKQGVAQFLVTNSVISTTDLDVQATGMRMHFNGTVDFEQRVDSRVEAELMRDLPGIGLLVSKILWPVTKIFEYRITGTLSDPKAEPVYIVPKILLLPLAPFKVIKDVFSSDPKSTPREAPK